jgi:putative Holliday junction resolvase
MDLKDSRDCQKCIVLKKVDLAKKTFPDIPIEMLDERFTSKMASAAIAQSGMGKRAWQSKELVDTV